MSKLTGKQWQERLETTGISTLEVWAIISDLIAKDEQLRELESECRLISVGERLPEEDGSYLILAFIDGVGEYYSVAQYIEGFFFDEYDNKTDDVDFWQPLPQPPESEE